MALKWFQWILFCSTHVPFSGLHSHLQLLGRQTHSCILHQDLPLNAGNCLAQGYATSFPGMALGHLNLGNSEESFQPRSSLQDCRRPRLQPHCSLLLLLISLDLIPSLSVYILSVLPNKSGCNYVLVYFQAPH